MEELKKYSEKDVQIVVVGNKADCEDLEVNEDELATFSMKHDIPCRRVSARSGEGVS